MLATGSLMVEAIQPFARQAGMALLAKATPPELDHFSHASVSAFPHFIFQGFQENPYLSSNALFFFHTAKIATANALIIDNAVNSPTFV
mgnify:CR=1 FL=1